ncbi:undecaprenyl-phosphate galactose phosphotransferase WbaP [Desulfovibrio cuneatus]|uniref:undecaprenyl-phosphate galactose phosphotransferase WbaP n=1 Tax=Desulfovibrio cuneatus TaxID=159728 RepID=UPI0004807E5B|nr:undecaprenyl-phosphate galactose phosphotransferase WbaP [Desulfovibrio cuneatus]
MQHASKTILGISKVSLVLALTDSVAVIAASALAFAVRALLPGDMPLSVYSELIPVQVVTFLCLFALMHLYPGILLYPAEELKRLFFAVSLGFLLVSASFFMLKSVDVYSRLFFLMAWAGSLVFVPLLRNAVRLRYWEKDWWKTDVIVVAEEEALAYLNAEQGRVRLMGFRDAVHLVPVYQDSPVSPGVQADNPEQGDHGTTVAFGNAETEVIPLSLDVFLQEQIEPLAQRYPEAVVVVHLPSLPREFRAQVLDAVGVWFHSVLVLPGQDWMPCRPAEIVHVGPSFGFTLRRNLADARRLQLKRCLDVCLTAVCCLAGLPLFALLALCIRLDSKGPVLFTQRRIGREGKAFNVYKFRTMQVDAEAALQGYLAQNPEAVAEWEASQKLKDDPRITKVGHFLRRTSLDELPQLINVLRGEMSVVGPRPIVPDEVDKYGEGYAAYARCLPGITGLWQISGRSDTSYEERVALDAFYMNNWSVWLDIYIVLRTVPVVLGRRGAY